MTKISPDEHCECGGQLVPPELTALHETPKGIDYVCLQCERAYAWQGMPPQLVVVVPSPSSE
jgi:hypothetical protein